MSPRENRSLHADKLAFIGAGKMAEALIAGIIKAKVASPKAIAASDILPARLSYLKKTYKINTAAGNQKTADNADIVILAVKPQVLAEVCSQLRVKNSALIVSIAAGVGLGKLQNLFPGNPVVRVMPNNPALVGAGITAVSAGERATKADLAKVDRIFRSVGEVVDVEEKLMDAVTGLSGSGPAFIYLMVEAMVEAGEKLGINKTVAEKLAVTTVLGSAQTLLKTKKSPRELREMVTSPGGTTLSGLRVLEERRAAEALMDAVIMAAKRAAELSQS
ncbi:pyrroline-5-carboxylate reductase [Candidatus Saganbacteria bacterium]|nr:pyrroline-5-carboxylate reductase [Candidatus Saganbacteria bacterium]